ncbi:MAG: hypothetical protein ACP5OU_01900 [Methanothrix sp.]
MNRKLVCILVIFALMLSVQNVIGPATTSAGSSGGSGSGGGGGGSKIDIDKLIKAVEDGKKSKPAKVEELKTLLWKDPITNENYTLPTVLLYYKGNTTLSRTEPLQIYTVITNNNPPEMRRMLDLYLEAKEPGSVEYRRVNSWPNKIQANDYSDKNTTSRIWNDLPSFAYLKEIGEVRLRVNVSDGVNKWGTAGYKDIDPPFFSELVLNVTNSLPEMSDFNVTPAGLVRYNDPIVYRANAKDSDGDLLNVTLHILDESGNEVRNETVNTMPGPIVFKANEYGFFAEAEAGKNFTYYYSYDDGIDFVSKDPEDPLPGPSIRKGAKLSVDRPGFSYTSENYYWWERYGFQVRAKNLNPEVYDVTFTLLTKTTGGEWTQVETKTEKIGPNPVVVYFNSTKPFLVSDASKTFHYRVKYSEIDENDRDFIEEQGVVINSKIVPYRIYDWVMVLNITLMLFIIAMTGFLMERSLQKGVEAHESASARTGGGKKAASSGSGTNVLDWVFKMLKRR